MRLLYCFVLATLILNVCRTMGQKQTYIVQMEKSVAPESFTDQILWYQSSLKSVSLSAEILYNYHTVVSGFSTQLTSEEAEDLRKKSEIVSVLPENLYKLHTTRSPEFLGLTGEEDLFQPGIANDVVIGIIDTGIWPESRSFDDTGLGPVPKSWRGKCEGGKNFKPEIHCNRKLIGARFFLRGYEAALGPIDESEESRSPVDDNGHGTHTSSTAAGNYVGNASFFGYAAGKARGMATGARLASYKACWQLGCVSSDILAAMEKAIEDGVNVLSLSLGGGTSDYAFDLISIGAFSAMDRGIFVACSAGNDGPDRSSISNVAPWITTVGSGTIDRNFPANIILGDGRKYSGVSIYTEKPPPNSQIPLVYAGNVSNRTGESRCAAGTLVARKVDGKIVVCDKGGNRRVEKGAVVKSAGGAGMIIADVTNGGEALVADAHILPAAGVGKRTGDAIKSYIESDINPTAQIIFSETKLGIQPSPILAAFSSRGPNPITQEILKPDIIAPGVNILAGWSKIISPTQLSGDLRRSEFNIASGTSMSCPHISGIAALLKGVHPTWSPSAIRSALMTTAYVTYPNGEKLLDVVTGKPSTPLDHGSGHVNPKKALDPGLVYDMTTGDYSNFLCALNYTPAEFKAVTKRSYSCERGKNYRVGDLNYPSFSLSLDYRLIRRNNGKIVLNYTRTVTNVGSPRTYRASVSPLVESVKIAVNPDTLSFSEMNEKKSYTVTFTAQSMPPGTTKFTRLEWSDGTHIVGSPIVISWDLGAKIIL